MPCSLLVFCIHIDKRTSWFRLQLYDVEYGIQTFRTPYKFFAGTLKGDASTNTCTIAHRQLKKKVDIRKNGDVLHCKVSAGLLPRGFFSIVCSRGDIVCAYSRRRAVKKRKENVEYWLQNSFSSIVYYLSFVLCSNGRKKVALLQLGLALFRAITPFKFDLVCCS